MTPRSRKGAIMRRLDGGARCGACVCASQAHIRDALGSRPPQLSGAAHARAGRGKDERGESPVLGRTKSPLSDPGSTAPGCKVAAVERRAVRVRRSGRPRRKAWMTIRALLGAPLPHVF